MIPALIAAGLAASVIVAPPVPTKPVKPCKDRVVAWIKEAGFKGANVRVAWAIASGLAVGKRGRISADITLAYQRAHRS